MAGGQLCGAEVWVSLPTSADWSTVPHTRAGRGAPSGHGAALHLPLPSGKGLLEVEKKACFHLPKTSSTFACLFPGRDSGTVSLSLCLGV